MPINSIAIFRALAIVLVVLCHAPALGALTIDTLLELFVWNMLSGGTTMFAFISGFLFHHVFVSRFDYRGFVAKKIRRLFVPYVVLSCVALAIGCSAVALDSFEGDFAAFRMAAYMLGSGNATMAYWYIPFALTLFAMAPLHVGFTKLSMRSQLAIISVLFVIALLIHRPVGNVGPVQNLMYFSPVYLLGIMCSQHRVAVYPILTRRRWPLLAATLGLALLQSMLGVSGGYMKHMLVFGGLDLMLLQKVCFCLFLLAFLRKFESARSKTVEVLADTSFAIYFLHPIVLQLFVQSAWITPQAEESWLRFAVISALCVMLCASVAWFARRIFGQQSRYVTGYWDGCKRLRQRSFSSTIKPMRINRR